MLEFTRTRNFAVWHCFGTPHQHARHQEHLQYGVPKQWHCKHAKKLKQGASLQQSADAFFNSQFAISNPQLLSLVPLTSLCGAATVPLLAISPR